MNNIIIFVIILFLLYLYINFNKSKTKYNKNKYNLYNGEYWNGYRLGDILYKRGGELFPLLKSIDKRWPNSIAHKYINNPNYHNQKKIDFNYLINIVDNYKYDKPPTDTLVIHLRIGDVIGMKQRKINYNYMNGINHYVKNKKYYKDILKKIKKYNIKKIHIIAGAHFNDSIEESTKYIDEIINIFNKQYYTKLIITNNPDKDFVYMSKSKYFCPSGGNYSNIIKDIILKKNNIIIQ